MSDEKIITFNIREAFKKPTIKRGRFATSLLRRLVAKAEKVREEDVFISNDVNSCLWLHGIKKPIKKIKIKIIKEDNKVQIFLPTEEIKVEEKKEKESKEEEKKEKAGKKDEEREGKKEEEMKEEKKTKRPKFSEKIMETTITKE